MPEAKSSETKSNGANLEFKTQLWAAADKMRGHYRKQSRTLAALREALLPKLLSGELRVPTAARRMEAKP